MESLPLGHYLTLRRPDNSELRFQNFHIGEPSDGHLFLPFGFSGVTVARDGSNVESTLVFPNNEVARAFADEAVRNSWIAVVRVCIVTRIDDPTTTPTTLHRYVGQVSAGGWNENSGHPAAEHSVGCCGQRCSAAHDPPAAGGQLARDWCDCALISCWGCGIASALTGAMARLIASIWSTWCCAIWASPHLRLMSAGMRRAGRRLHGHSCSGGAGFRHLDSMETFS